MHTWRGYYGNPRYDGFGSLTNPRIDTELLRIHTAAACATCVHSTSTDPKCGLCAGPTTKTSRYQPITIKETP